MSVFELLTIEERGDGRDLLEPIERIEEDRLRGRGVELMMDWMSGLARPLVVGKYSRSGGKSLISILARESSATEIGKSSSSSLMGVGDTRENGGAEREAFDEAFDSVRARVELELLPETEGDNEGTPFE